VATQSLSGSLPRQKVDHVVFANRVEAKFCNTMSVLDNKTKICNDTADLSADESVLLPLVQSSSAELLHGKIAESSSQNLHSPSYNSPTPTRGSMGESTADLG
jgi:hypothetical protein